MSRRYATLLAVCIAAGVGACNENLDSGGACPALCPAQAVVIRDTILSPALVFDSTFVGYPQRGQEQSMLLATRGDTLETRGVVRFDSLTTFFTPANYTSHAISHVDSSRVRLVLDRTQAKLPAQVRFEVYDVDDSTAADTSATAVLTLFRANRLIGQRTFFRDSLTDTLFVPLSDSAVLSKITNKAHLRLGLRVDGSGPVSLRVETVETGNSALVSYRPSTDTTVSAIVVSPLSASPAGTNFPEIRNDLLDYTLVAKYGLPQMANTMIVGGIPGRRVYLRFNIPRYITDSTTVIKASLRLTQRPLPFGDATDTMTVHAQVVLAGPDVTDLRHAADIISAPLLLVLDSMLISPRDSGVRSLEMYGLLRAWGAQVTLANPPLHAVVLRASPESVLPFEARFFSTTAPASVRPVMVISYIPKTQFGVP
jgi:hypothetical protein